MPEYVRGRPDGIRCMVEGAVAKCGLFTLEHDGSGGDSRFFTRVYRGILDGKPINTWIRFRYDYRTGWADVSMSYDNLKVLKWLQEEVEQREKNEAIKEVKEEVPNAS